MIIGGLINVYHNYSITLFMPFLNMTFEVASGPDVGAPFTWYPHTCGSASGSGVPGTLTLPTLKKYLPLYTGLIFSNNNIIIN